MTIKRRSMALLLVAALLLTSVVIVNAQGGEGIPATVTGFVYVRALPDVKAADYGRLDPESELTLYARIVEPRSGETTWFMVMTADDVMGWVRVDSVNLTEGSIEDLPQMEVAREDAAVLGFATLRLGPDLNAPSGERLSQGTLLTLSAISADGGWVYGMTADGIGGWVQHRALQYSRAPRADQPSVPELPEANGAVGGYLNMRVLPDVEAPDSTRLNPGTPVNVVGRSADDNWLQVETLDGITGWGPARNVLTNEDVAALDVTEIDAESQGVVVTFANLRALPDSTSDMIGTLESGTVVNLNLVNADRAYVEAGDLAGWVPADALAYVGGVRPDVLSGNATVTVNADTANLRAGAGTEFATQGNVRNGQRIAVTGQNADGTWYYVVPPTRVGAWISADLVSVDAGVVIPVQG